MNSVTAFGEGPAFAAWSIPGPAGSRRPLSHQVVFQQAEGKLVEESMLAFDAASWSKGADREE
jgi:hypothetical protein